MQRLKIYIIWANRWTSKEWWKILGCSSLRSCAKGETADYRPWPGVWVTRVRHYDNLLVIGYEVLMDVTMYIYACVFVYLYQYLGELYTPISTRYMKETWKITMSIVYLSFWDVSIFFLRSWTGIREGMFSWKMGFMNEGKRLGCEDIMGVSRKWCSNIS